MGGVVLIYAREDAFEAHQIALRLEQASYPVEVRVSLGFGPESFKEQLHSFIGAATGVVVLWSFSSIHNRVIRSYSDIAAEKGNLVSVLSSYQLPWPPSVEDKLPTSRYEYYQIPKSAAASLFPPWLTVDNYYTASPPPPPPPPPAPTAPWYSLEWAESSSLSDMALFALPGIIIVGSFIWGAARGALSIELVGWGVLCAALVNLVRGLRA
jgi:hypothetical protein